MDIVDVILLIFSVAIHGLDVTTDILVLISFWAHGSFTWFWISLAILFTSFLLAGLSAWADEERGGLLEGMMAFLQVGVIVNACRSIYQRKMLKATVVRMRRRVQPLIGMWHCLLTL